MKQGRGTMKFRFLAQISLLFLLFVPVQANGDPDDYKEEAKKAIPRRPSTYEELYKPFEPILCPQVDVQFKKIFMIMFDEKFPPPRHSDATILNGFWCLYSRMADAHKNSESLEEKVQLQLDALNQTAAFHIVSIATFNKELADQIPNFPCENCRVSAKAELGIETKSEGYITRIINYLCNSFYLHTS
jgi:hypothetical protein